MWFQQDDADGNGRCLLDGSKCYYMCMTCVEYELETIG